MTEHAQNSPNDNPGHQGFDYCFWSKTLVGIVLFPLVLAIAAMLFTGIVARIVAGAIAIGVLIYAAIKIDQMPCFASKIPPMIGKGDKKD